MTANDARSVVLERIRNALTDVPQSESPESLAIPRGYRTSADLAPNELVDLFCNRVADYKAVVHRIDASMLRETIAEIGRRRGGTDFIVPIDLPEGWLPEGPAFRRDSGQSYDQLDAIAGVITGAKVGIAQTGTIVLDSSPGQGRRAISLIPDYHLCIIGENAIVGTVPEAIAILEASASAPGHPITFISGPSATSDIELNRVEGVHGPRTLEVLVVANLSA